MFYLRRRSDGQYLYYMNGDSTSLSNKYKDAIPFKKLETAEGIKEQVEESRKEKFEIVEIKTSITVVSSVEEQVEEQVDEQ